jgi:hypothetical protein
MKEKKKLKVIFPADLLRKYVAKDIIPLVNNELTRRGIQIEKGLYVQMSWSEVQALVPESYEPGSHSYEEFLMRYTVDMVFQFVVESTKEQIEKLLPRVSTTTEELSKFSSCSALLTQEFGPDLPCWCVL